MRLQKQHVVLFSFAKPYMLKSILALVMNLVGLGLGLFPPLITMRIIDHGIKSGSVKTICIYISLCIGAVLLSRGSSFACEMLMNWIQRGILVDMRTAVYKKLLILDYKLFKEQHSSKLFMRVTGDIDNLQSLLSMQIVHTLSNLIFMVVVIVIMFKMSWMMTLLSLTILPLFFFSYNLLMKGVFDLGRRVQESKENLIGNIKDDIAGIQLVRSAGAEKKRSQLASLKIQSVEGLRLQLMKRSALANLSTTGIDILGIGILWGAGSYFVLQGQATVGTLVAFSGLFSMVYGPIRNLCQVIFSFNTSLASAERIYEILGSEEEVSTGTKEITQFTSDLTLKDVSFRYGLDAPWVFRNLNISIEKGKSYALTGANGSGKTTLFNLLSRLYNPTSGEILMDKVPIHEYHQGSYRKLFGYVSQVPVFFDDTIQYNMSLEDIEYSPQEILDALEKSSAMDFIKELPQGLQTKMGENGDFLSGGQKQRLSIARALLGNPQILLFDESDSNIDKDSQDVVFETVERLRKEHTLIFITHSPKILSYVDEVIRFDPAGVTTVVNN